jgi:glycosyltransferase involved in cell wall biosynthesis
MARIAFFSSTFPDFESCGTGIYAGYLTQALSEQDHDVHVITTAIPEIKNTFGRVTVHKALQNWNLFEAPRLVAAVNRIKPDVIHINHPTLIAAAKTKFLVFAFPEMNAALWNFPLITTLHEFPNVSKLGRLKMLPLLMGSDLITVTNEFYKNDLCKFLPAGQRHKIEVVNIGAQWPAGGLPIADRAEQRAKFGLDETDQILGFVGFVSPPKGFENLIEAAAPLLRERPHLKILACSSWNQTQPAYRQKIQSLIAREKIQSQVIFTGYLRDEELWSALAAIDVAVFPFEHPIEERSSGVLRQVLYYGLPTIAFARSTSYSEFDLQHQKNIWLTPHKNITHLRADISMLCDQPLVRARLASGALQLRPGLSFDSISNSFSRLYSQVLRRS